MWKVDFHCHTRRSKDSLTAYPALLQAAERKGLNKIVVTDHNTIAGALEAQALAPERVIVGEEIMTEGGELLAVFVKEEIPRGLSPLEAIGRLREQGAFISVSHPFDTTRNGSWNPADLEQIAPLVDAVEVFNARCLQADFNQKAAAFAHRHRLGGTAGSDGHGAAEIGAAYLVLPAFQEAASLRLALQEAQVVGRLSPVWVHFYSIYARWMKARKSNLR